MGRYQRAERFEDLIVWKKAFSICLEIYRLTSKGPLAHDSPLRYQLRKAAVSTISNIAEGFGRYGYHDFRHFLSMANGSTNEVRAQLHLVNALGYADTTEIEDLIGRCSEISRMIKGLRNNLKASTQRTEAEA